MPQLIRLGVLTDLHRVSASGRTARWHNEYDFDGLDERLLSALSLLSQDELAGVAVLGDLTHDGDLISTQAVLELVAGAVNRPVWFVPGNHDNLDKHGLLTDALGGRGSSWLRSATASGERIAAGVWLTGLMADPDEVEDACTSLLATRHASGSALLVVLSHYPVLSRVDALAEAGLRYAGDSDHHLSAGEALRLHGPALVLGGHLHVRDSHADGGILQLLFGSLIEYPHDVSVVEIERPDRGTLAIRRAAISSTHGRVDKDPVLASANETWIYHQDSWRRATL